MELSRPIDLVRRILDSEAGRRQPLRVLSRVAAWQMWRRVLRRPMIFRANTGSRLFLLPGASDSISGFWYQSLPDFEELVFALHLLGEGGLFVDVGANQGGWSLLLAGRGAQVICFEPVAETFGRLQANIAANPSEIRRRIRAVPLGPGEQAMQVRFTAGLDAANHRIRTTGDAKSETTVQLMPANEALRGEEPALIKIDVEGEELGVLLGAREILAKECLKAVVMETFRPQNCDQQDFVTAEALLREHGFAPMSYDPWRRELRPLAAREGGQNTIYVRATPALTARLRGAAQVSVFGREL
jgi:FkbM family methyltransferase